jgi:hypothetical protein
MILGSNFLEVPSSCAWTKRSADEARKKRNGTSGLRASFIFDSASIEINKIMRSSAPQSRLAQSRVQQQRHGTGVRQHMKRSIHTFFLLSKNASMDCGTVDSVDDHTNANFVDEVR